MIVRPTSKKTVEFVDFSTGQVNGTTWTNSIPTGAKSGDFLLMYVNVRGSATTTISTPTDWTPVLDFAKSTAGRVYVFMRRAIDSTPSPTLVASGSSTHLSAILTFKGVSSSSPIVEAVSASGTVSGTAHPTPALTGLVPDRSMVLRSVTFTGVTNGSFTWPAPSIELVDFNGGLAAALSVGSEFYPNSSAVGALNATASSSGGSYGTATIALRPGV